MLAQEARRSTDATAPVPELVDIVSNWPTDATEVLRTVPVPVHYRQGIHDGLWNVSPTEVKRFAATCSSAPRVNYGIFLNS